MGTWVSASIRNEVVDFVDRYGRQTGLGVSRLIGWLGIGRDKFYAWRLRYGRENEHNGAVPRDFWLEEWEKEAILAFYRLYPNEGYRRMTYRMIDEDIVAVSPATTYRVLREAGLIRRWNRVESRKGTGFVQPLRAHDHWHVDVSYLNICGTFYYFCGLLDGYSRYLVHWEIREAMKEADVEIVIQRAREKFPQARPRIISDNGPQFIAKDFKEFVRLSGMTHVRTSPYYPQSNGKIERFHQSLKNECIRPRTPLSLEDARHTVTDFVDRYNTVRLHAAIGYIAPKDQLEGRAEAIRQDRNRKLAEACERRKRMADQKTNRTEESTHSTPHLDTSQTLGHSLLSR